MRRRPRGEAPTGPRRVHLTDAEWSQIGAAAERRAVSRSRLIAERTMPGLVRATLPPEVMDLIDEVRYMSDGVAQAVARADEALAPVDLLRLCERLDRIDARLAEAVRQIGRSTARAQDLSEACP